MVWGMWNSSYLRPAVGFEDAAWTTPVHGAVWFASKTFLLENLLEGEINRICEKTIDNMQMQQMWTQRLPSLKLTLRTWKWMLFCRRSDSFWGRPIFSGAFARCQFQGGGIFLPSYIKPLWIFKWWGHLLPPKKTTPPRSSGFLLQCIGASKKDGFPVEVGWGRKSLSHKMGGNRPHDNKLYIEWGYNSKKPL